MNNVPRIVVPNSFEFNHHRVNLASPVTLLQQGTVPTVHAIGGMTMLEEMVSQIAGSMSDGTPQQVVLRAKELLDECARVQGGG